jgi:hypothetical protein
MMNRNMLKKFYIVSLGLLVVMGNIIIMQGGLITDQKAKPGILGVIENKMIKTPQVTKNSTKEELTNPSKTVLSQSETKKYIEIEVKLEGNGCNENKAPNICKIASNQKPGVVLKQCDDKSWDICNFYLYELGKRDGDIQYILQSYTENTDRLVDILSYDTKTNLVSQVKTVLRQDTGTDGTDLNSEYDITIAQYKVK